jgi:hypothetical protein
MTGSSTTSRFAFIRATPKRVTRQAGLTMKFKGDA